MKKLSITFWCNLMLIFAAAIWGSSFAVQKIVATDIGPFTFMAARSLLGSLTILLLIVAGRLATRRKMQQDQLSPPSYDKAYLKKLFQAAPLCGVINVTGSVLVQAGLVYTTASKAGFIGAIYIVFVPIIGFIFFKKNTGKLTLLGILLATVGLYLLCITASFTIGKGDLIILLSTLCFSLHIHLLNKYIHIVNGMHLTCLEFFSAGIYCSLMALLFESPSFGQLIQCSFSIVFSGVLGIGICYALQVTAQKHTEPTLAALLMSTESIFSAMAGVFFLHESFIGRELIGIFFIVAAIIVAQQPSKKEPVTFAAEDC